MAALPESARSSLLNRSDALTVRKNGKGAVNVLHVAMIKDTIRQRFEVRMVYLYLHSLCPLI